jgi:diguanylate cyclase (GGDEF)-like protein
MPNPETLTPPSRGVHYLGSDPELLNDLTALVEPKGLRVRGFSDVTDLAEAAAAPPAVLILDLGIMPSQATAEQLLIELYPKPGQRPELICIGGEDTMETRLKAMRAGAKGFIAAPVSPRRLAQKAIQLAGADRPEPYRILVVEDDAAQARYLALMLRNAGMTVDVVLEPLKVLNTMKEFHPDLVLMDLYLPGASGAELTAVIRDHDELYDIPIVFLSSEEDLDKQLDALRVGADSFMAKPVHRKALVGTIEHRIRMARWLKERRAEASRPEDASGLMRKDSFLRQLDRGLRNPQACGPGCGLVLLELDAHKQIFDRLGIVGTERLMRQVENQILKRLNPDEAAARLADFTYGVLARRPDPTKLQDLAERLRRGLAQGRVPGEGEPKHPTVSIGVGLFDPPADDALTMVSRARKAAKGARQEGGNRVRL